MICEGQSVDFRIFEKSGPISGNGEGNVKRLACQDHLPSSLASEQAPPRIIPPPADGGHHATTLGFPSMPSSSPAATPTAATGLRSSLTSLVPANLHVMARMPCGGEAPTEAASRISLQGIASGGVVPVGATFNSITTMEDASGDGGSGQTPMSDMVPDSAASAADAGLDLEPEELPFGDMGGGGAREAWDPFQGPVKAGIAAREAARRASEEGSMLGGGNGAPMVPVIGLGQGIGQDGDGGRCQSSRPGQGPCLSTSAGEPAVAVSVVQPAAGSHLGGNLKDPFHTSVPHASVGLKPGPWTVAPLGIGHAAAPPCAHAVPSTPSPGIAAAEHPWGGLGLPGGGGGAFPISRGCLGHIPASGGGATEGGGTPWSESSAFFEAIDRALERRQGNRLGGVDNVVGAGGGGGSDKDGGIREAQPPYQSLVAGSGPHLHPSGDASMQVAPRANDLPTHAGGKISSITAPAPIASTEAAFQSEAMQNQWQQQQQRQPLQHSAAAAAVLQPSREVSPLPVKQLAFTPSARALPVAAPDPKPDSWEPAFQGLTTNGLGPPMAVSVPSTSGGGPFSFSFPQNAPPPSLPYPQPHASHPPIPPLGPMHVNSGQGGSGGGHAGDLGWPGVRGYTTPSKIRNAPEPSASRSYAVQQPLFAAPTLPLAPVPPLAPAPALTASATTVLCSGGRVDSADTNDAPFQLLSPADMAAASAMIDDDDEEEENGADRGLMGMHRGADGVRAIPDQEGGKAGEMRAGVGAPTGGVLQEGAAAAAVEEEEEDEDNANLEYPQPLTQQAAASLERRRQRRLRPLEGSASQQQQQQPHVLAGSPPQTTGGQDGGGYGGSGGVVTPCPPSVPGSGGGTADPGGSVPTQVCGWAHAYAYIYAGAQAVNYSILLIVPFPYL